MSLLKEVKKESKELKENEKKERTKSFLSALLIGIDELKLIESNLLDKIAEVNEDIELMEKAMKYIDEDKIDICQEFPRVTLCSPDFAFQVISMVEDEL